MAHRKCLAVTARERGDAPTLPIAIDVLRRRKRDNVYHGSILTTVVVSGRY